MVLAILVAGFLVARAIRESGRRHAEVELDRIKNSLEYRTQVAAIRDYLDFKEVYNYELLDMREEEVELASGQLARAKKDALARSIRVHKQALEEMLSASAAKYEGSPYNPRKLPFVEWPSELYAEYERLEETKRRQLQELEG